MAEEDGVSHGSYSQFHAGKSARSPMNVEPFFAGWSKKELEEAEDIKLLRRETQTSLLGTVFLLVAT